MQTSTAIWKLIDSMYTNMTSCVRSGGKFSRNFTLQRGIRQGGVLSAKLYLLFINQLLDDLSTSSKGAYVLDMNCSCPTQADDIAIISSSHNGLQDLINLCQSYSSKWRFSFSPSKSVFLKFNYKPNSYVSGKSVMLFNYALPIADSIKHVGVILNSRKITKDRTAEACRIIRSHSAILQHLNVLNPLTTSKLLQRCVYPKALYGCQLWFTLPKADILSLERAQRYVCKRIQHLHRRTRTDVCLGLLAWFSVESYIDRQKLLFLGQLLNLSPKYLPRHLLVTRILEYKYSCNPTNLGFVPDIFRLLKKYGLISYISNFLVSYNFVKSHVWKKVVKSSINEYEINQWHNRLDSDPTLELFRCVQIEFRPHPIFALWRSNPNYREACLLFIKALSIVRVNVLCTSPNVLCEKCGKMFSCIVVHVLLYCEGFDRIRNMFWTKLAGSTRTEFYSNVTQTNEREILAFIFRLDPFHISAQYETYISVQRSILNYVSMALRNVRLSPLNNDQYFM